MEIFGSWPVPWGRLTATYRTAAPGGGSSTPTPSGCGVPPRLRVEHSARIARAALPALHGVLPGRVEFYSETLGKQGLPPLPTYMSGRAWTTRPSGGATLSAATSRRTASSSTRRSAKSALLRARQGGPTVLVHPDDAATRHRRGDLSATDGAGAFLTAVLSDDTLPAEVVVEGIWVDKFMPGGPGVNVLTSDGLADMGGWRSTRTMVDVGPATRRRRPFPGVRPRGGRVRQGSSRRGSTRQDGSRLTPRSPVRSIPRRRHLTAGLYGIY